MQSPGLPGVAQMSVVLGSGEHRYRVVENWAKLPDGWSFKDVAAVAVDGKDQVYVFNRGEHPMMVFDREGNFLRSWGEGVFHRAHGLHIDSPRHPLLHRRRRPHRAQVLDRGQDRAHHRRSRQARPLHERRAVPSLHPHGAFAQGRHLRLGRLRQCARAQVLARPASCSCPGASPAPSPASSTSPTTSPPTTTAGSTSPTARTTASRCSTATASTRRSGTTCTARAGSIAAAARRRPS